MLDRKRKLESLTYGEFITKILNYTDYPFGEEKPLFKHTKIGQVVTRKMGYAIQEGEFVLQQPRRAREQRNTPPSNTLNEIRDEQRKMYVKINMNIKKMASKHLISPTRSSEDDDEIN